MVVLQSLVYLDTASYDLVQTSSPVIRLTEDDKRKSLGTAHIAESGSL